MTSPDAKTTGVPVRYDAKQLRVFAEALFTKSGLTPSQAEQTAEMLVEGDLLGHTTHGLQLLAPYLRDIEAGRMCIDGEPSVIADRPCALTWDGRLPAGAMAGVQSDRRRSAIASPRKGS